MRPPFCAQKTGPVYVPNVCAGPISGPQCGHVFGLEIANSGPILGPTAIGKPRTPEAAETPTQTRTIAHQSARIRYPQNNSDGEEQKAPDGQKRKQPHSTTTPLQKDAVAQPDKPTRPKARLAARRVIILFIAQNTTPHGTTKRKHENANEYGIEYRCKPTKA